VGGIESAGTRGKIGAMIASDPAAPFRDTLTAEICYALGASRTGSLHKFLSPLLRRPLGRLAGIAARADAESAVSGLPGAARRILPDFSMRPAARGIERIPAAGPLLVVSNHPGGLDSLAVLAALPRRDVKVVLSDSPLTRTFKSARDFFIYAPLSAGGGAAALRACLRQLRGGGAVLIFANGDVEPDPELVPQCRSDAQGSPRDAAPDSDDQRRPEARVPSKPAGSDPQNARPTTKAGRGPANPAPNDIASGRPA
jgi:hypothetical protein